MMEKEREILNRVKKYIMDVAWPYVVEHKGSFCTYEIEEIELSEEEKCHIISEWNVVFYPDQEESYGHLNCFIALFKTGEIGFFRKTKEQWLEEAISHYKAEQYERTLCACEQILKLDSNNTRAYHGKGLSLLKLGCVKNALTIYEQVIKIAPNKAETYYYEAGNILCELGQFQEALAVYNQVLKLNPRNDKACVAKGYMLLELERYEEVFAACKQAIQINSSNINDYKNIASTLKYMGRHEEALIAYTHLIPFMPNDYDLHFQRSFLLFKLFKLEEALKSIEKSISINPTSHAYCMYGDIFFDLKRYKEALAAYEKSIDFIDTSDNVYYTMKSAVIVSKKPTTDSGAYFTSSSAMKMHWLYITRHTPSMLDPIMKRGISFSISILMKKLLRPSRHLLISTFVMQMHGV